MRWDPRPEVGMTEEDGDDGSASDLVFRATVPVVLRMLRSRFPGDPLVRFERRRGVSVSGDVERLDCPLFLSVLFGNTR